MPWLNVCVCVLVVVGGWFEVTSAAAAAAAAAVVRVYVVGQLLLCKLDRQEEMAASAAMRCWRSQSGTYVAGSPSGASEDRRRAGRELCKLRFHVVAGLAGVGMHLRTAQMPRGWSRVWAMYIAPEN
jgi:hypothetical protein